MYRLIFSLMLLLFYVKVSHNAALSIQEQKKYKELIDGQGLYSADDDVEILTKANFRERLYEQKNAWVVEFYNSWCGFCQRFAPSWKALATDIHDWKDKINVGAIDCSDDDNNVICREFEIMAYPTLRYFHENYTEGPKKTGDDLDKGEDVTGHKQYILNKMVTEQKHGRGKQFPNLSPYNYTNLNHLFDGIPINTKYVFLVIEKDTRYGMEVALDLANVPLIAVRYALSDNVALLKNLGASNNLLPYMVVLSDTNESVQFTNLNSRENLKMTIHKFLKPKDINVPSGGTELIYTGKWLDENVPDISSLIEARERKTLRDKIKKMGDVIFQGDLETALRYALKHEISSATSITGDKRNALIKFVDVMLKYFPLTNNGRSFMYEISEKIKSHDPVYGTDLVNIINKMEDPDEKIFSSHQQWLACDGSTTKYRGYPCGLWKLFHYLTVNAASNGNDPQEVLQTMHGYVKHFFGCADCSKHFQEMAKERQIDAVKTMDDAILWLWSAHNVVNKRLAGDTTEDPEFPKVQFPTIENCPTCRKSDGSFNEAEVLKYLKNMYSNLNVRYIGSDTTLLLRGLGQTYTSDTSLIKTIDTSMCFILYVASLILIIALIRIFLKRGYRKKMYVHDLLGKV